MLWTKHSFMQKNGELPSRSLQRISKPSVSQRLPATATSTESFIPGKNYRQHPSSYYNDNQQLSHRNLPLTDYTNSSHNNNLVLENLHQSLNRQIDNVNPLTVSYSATSSTLSPNTTSDVSPTSDTANKNTCSTNDSQHHSSLEKKKCIELQAANNNNNNNNNNNSNNSHNLMDPTATTNNNNNNNNSNDELHLNGSVQKTHCCMPPISISSSVSSSAVTALQQSTADLAREQWYVHHAHHTPAHPHQQLADEFVMYAPALTSSSPSSSIGKFGIESSTESYLSSRYNVNVKGVRHERASSFFDIPAVTHPYCYRFPSSPPAGILKKNDDDPSFCNNASVTSSLQFGQHYHNAKAEHPDSTTTHLTNHHPHSAHPHNQHQHHHHHAHAHSTNLHHQHAHLSPHSSAFKFSHSPSSVYHHQYNGQAAAATYGLRTAADITPGLALAPVSTTTELDIKYENPYNSAISSTYTLRPSSGVDSSTAVSSTDADFKLESLYAANNSITTSHTVSQRRGSLQLWQFLVALLDEPNTNSSCIAWTGRGMEFKLIEPEEVARRWGLQKNRPAMNYDKLSRSLRYYYEKGIMQKVNGERYVYRFVCDPEALFNMAYGHLGNSASAAATKSDHHQQQHHSLQQHHHHHHHHLLTSPTSSTKANIESISTSTLEDDANRERTSGLKHHEQLFYGKF